MGKKKDKKNSSWDGKSTSYDYLKDKFDKNYTPYNGNRQSTGVYNDKRDAAFQRYLNTGDKYSGMNAGEANFRKKLDKQADRKPSIEETMFEAGIPVSQWDYYAKKAGVGNVNKRKEANKIIEAYNQDERYQPDPEQTIPDVPEPMSPEPAPEPRFNIDVETANAEEAARDLRIDEYEKNRATGGFFGNEAANSYLDDYKLNVSTGLQKAEVPTRGPLAPSFIL